MTDAVLIASKDKAQNVKEVVASLKSKEAPQAELFPRIIDLGVGLKILPLLKVFR